MPQKGSKAEETKFYKGVKIDPYPVLRLRISVPEMQRIIDLQQTTGFSVAKIIASICQPCNSIDNLVSVYDHEGIEFKIPKGLLKKRY